MRKEGEMKNKQRMGYTDIKLQVFTVRSKENKEYTKNMNCVSYRNFIYVH